MTTSPISVLLVYTLILPVFLLIAQNRMTGTVVPAIFLGVAAFLLNVVLRRLVATQRDQIAVLKAFGYPNASVALHYLGLALVAVALGAVLGSALGLWWGKAIHRLYMDFYRFAVWGFEAGPRMFALAIGVAGIAALVGALDAVRAAVALPPAEAMRPEAPRLHDDPRFERNVNTVVEQHFGDVARGFAQADYMFARPTSWLPVWLLMKKI